MRIAVFVSGSGTNLQAIIDAVESGKLTAEIGLVFSSNPDAFALERAKKHGIPAVVMSSKDFGSRDEFIAAALATLGKHGIDFIALAGYMKMVPPEIVRAFRNRIVNIHPALLPSFGGKGMYGMNVHKAVVEYGCKVTGVTVHIVDEQYDHGAVVAQRCVPVLDDDTPESLAARVLEIEHQLYAHALQLFATDTVKIEGGKIKVIA